MIIQGRFLTHAVRLPRADGRGYELVLRTEEKGSDVNLASHLLHDALSLTDAQRKELERRLEAYRSAPDATISWESLRQELLQS